MAYQTGSSTGQTDLINKLQTFAAANGFTVNNYDAGNHFCSISRAADNLYSTIYWDTTTHMAIYQALGYSGTYAQQPWNQANDSGNGNSTLAQIYSGRNVNNIGAGPFTSYYFFAYTDPYSLHIILEFSPGLYRHFGMGSLQKSSTWTGGAYVYGHHWNSQNSGAPLDDPDVGHHSVFLDGAHDPSYGTYGYSINTGATLHCEGLPSQPSGGKWGVSMSAWANYPLVDRAAVDRVRVVGGCRGGIALSQFGWLLPDKAAGFIPIIPFESFYVDGDASSPPITWRHLGRVANVGHIHLHGIDPAEELTVGPDTWTAFPAVRKAMVGGNNQESWNMGIIYRKVT